VHGVPKAPGILSRGSASTFKVLRKSFLVSKDPGLLCLSDELDHVALLGDSFFEHEPLRANWVSSAAGICSIVVSVIALGDAANKPVRPIVIVAVVFIALSTFLAPNRPVPYRFGLNRDDVLRPVLPAV
jgi:hypothetical protein